MHFTWSNPPDLCLLAILAHIPLCKLIRTFGLVCKYLARLQQDELNSRQTLALAPFLNDQEKLTKLRENPYGSDLIRHVQRDDGRPWIRLRSIDYINRDVLEISEPDKYDSYVHFYQPVLNILPNISHLTIVRYNPDFQVENTTMTPLFQMTSLLTHFHQSGQLKSLKIELENFPWLPQYNITTELVDNLIESINELKSLRHLTMNIPFRDLKPTSPLTILSRLESFTAHQFTHTEFLIDSFRQYATGDVPMRSMDCRVRMTLEQMNSFDRQLNKKFVSTSIVNSLTVTDYNNLRLFCSEFSLLSTLRLSTHSMPMSMITRCLVQLRNLIHLNLTISICILKTIQEENIETMTQLPSIRLLALTIETRSHHGTEHLQLDIIFPNLQVLDLIHNPIACDECEYGNILVCPHSGDVLQVNNTRFMEFHRQEIEQCMCKARQPFRDCAKLHTIKLKSYRNLLAQGLITRDRL